MKIAVTFSLDSSVVLRFDELVKKKGLNRNRVVESIMEEWVKSNTIVKCPKCGAEYSVKLGKCPQCENK